MASQPENKFKGLKSGDKVFVVYQQTRWQQRDGKPPVTEWKEVTKVGRVYGTIERYQRPVQFLLSNGQSWHGADENARYNNMGFDVYATEEEYLAKVREAQVREGLAECLGIPQSERAWISKLPIDIVFRFRVILENYGWENG